MSSQIFFIYSACKQFRTFRQFWLDDGCFNDSKSRNILSIKKNILFYLPANEIP